MLQKDPLGAPVLDPTRLRMLLRCTRIQSNSASSVASAKREMRSGMKRGLCMLARSSEGKWFRSKILHTSQQYMRVQNKRERERISLLPVPPCREDTSGPQKPFALCNSERTINPMEPGRSGCEEVHAVRAEELNCVDARCIGPAAWQDWLVLAVHTRAASEHPVF